MSNELDSLMMQADLANKEAREASTRTHSHTPGPWTVGEDEHGVAVVESLDGMTLCEVYPYAGPDYRELLPGNAGEANAQLMAAAPELLAEVASKDKTIEALRKEVERWKSMCDSLGRDNEECDAELTKEEAWMP